MPYHPPMGGEHTTGDASKWSRVLAGPVRLYELDGSNPKAVRTPAGCRLDVAAREVTA